MKFPEYLKMSDTIGVTAVSDGAGDELDKIRFYNGKKKLEDLGYRVEFTENVFQVAEKGRSSSGQRRAEEFNKLVSDERVSVIISAKGGNFLNEMLEYVDFERFAHHPKWFQGYSDNTCLVHSLTTKYDVATIYGSNFGEFGMDIWHESVSNNLELLCGQRKEQHSFERYQDGFVDKITGLEGYSEDKEVRLKVGLRTAKDGDEVTFGGRLIGGCLDVLLFLQGTKYDGTAEFLEKYKEDGIIWYLETFDISGENLMMFLWKLKEIGWFRYTRGFLFGRPLFYKDYTDTPYEEAVMYALGNLDVPVVFDCDLGHKGPRFTMINGARATVQVKEGKGMLSYT